MKTKTADAAKSDVALAVKRIAREFDPEAEVILYGSRARGDAEADSDWDFLILTARPFSFAEEEELHAKMYGVQIEKEVVFSTMLEPESRWRASRNVETSFYANVEREGSPV